MPPATDTDTVMLSLRPEDRARLDAVHAYLSEPEDPPGRASDSATLLAVLDAYVRDRGLPAWRNAR